MKSADNLFDKYRVLSICSFLVIGAAEIGWIFFVVALICGLPILFAAMFAVGSGNTDRLVEVAVRNVKGGVQRPCCINHRTSAEYPYP